VDRIIERVQEILDMHPDHFKVTVKLDPKYDQGNIAAYKPGLRTIHVFADRITDGVFAHEVAHAVICSYFSVPPPEKVQEILCQYVDRHLWEDF
jgi:hypothetical protein